jgi:prepilin-type N-terminal cleavage/methylation domain-containing protein/prepilin-type processing-associated H-X9-DG protein
MSSKTPFVSHTARRGFTLVELLVVIGIIALLISILLPALTAARQQAQSARCMSNLRQMATAVMGYANENKLWINAGYQGPLTVNGVDYVQYAFYAAKIGDTNPDTRYNYNLGFFSKWTGKGVMVDCPAFEFEASQVDFTIGANADNRSAYGVSPVANGVRLSAIRSSAETALFADASSVWTNGMIKRTSIIYPPSSRRPMFHGRHGKGTGNVAWFDGHVTNEKPNMTSTITFLNVGSQAQRRPLNIGDLAFNHITISTIPTPINTYHRVNWYFISDKRKVID